MTLENKILLFTCYVFQRKHKHNVIPPHWHDTGSWPPPYLHPHTSHPPWLIELFDQLGISLTYKNFLIRYNPETPYRVSYLGQHWCKWWKYLQGWPNELIPKCIQKLDNFCLVVPYGNGSGSALVQVMVCCFWTLSHYRDPVLTSYCWGSAGFSREGFHGEWPSYCFVWKSYFQNYCYIFQRLMSWNESHSRYTELTWHFQLYSDEELLAREAQRPALVQRCGRFHQRPPIPPRWRWIKLRSCDGQRGTRGKCIFNRRPKYRVGKRRDIFLKAR